MLVTGLQLLPPEDPLEALLSRVESAVVGGLQIVQLREPSMASEVLAQWGKAIRARIGGRAKLALNCRSGVFPELKMLFDWLHFPEAWLSGPRQDPGMPFGVSVHGDESAQRATDAGASYLVAGPVFETTTHPGAPGRGLEFLAQICRSAAVPTLAIGGITPDRVRECLEVGARGVAVRSPILTAQDPCESARQFRVALDAAENATRSKRKPWPSGETMIEPAKPELQMSAGRLASGLGAGEGPNR